MVAVKADKKRSVLEEACDDRTNTCDSSLTLKRNAMNGRKQEQILDIRAAATGRTKMCASRTRQQHYCSPLAVENL